MSLETQRHHPLIVWLDQRFDLGVQRDKQVEWIITRLPIHKEAGVEGIHVCVIPLNHPRLLRRPRCPVRPAVRTEAFLHDRIACRDSDTHPPT